VTALRPSVPSVGREAPDPRTTPGTEEPAPTRPRTLTEALRALDREALITLLRLRPDLAHPAPTDLVDLAARATTTASVARAVDALNAYQRVVAEALAASPAPATVSDVADLLDHPCDDVAPAVHDLRARALVWGDDDQLQLVRAVREIFEPYPGGLAPPSIRPLDEGQIRAALDACDESVRPVLDRLAWWPTGAVRNATRPVDLASARSPVEQLLARRLIKPLDSDTVIIPREVAWLLRNRRFTPEPVPPQPPPIPGRPQNRERVDQAAAGAAVELLHDVELAVHGLESTSHRLLRSGGLSTRDIGALARNLGSSPAHAGFLLEVAAAAELVAPASNLCLLPTAAYDRWLTHDAAVRWRQLADAWLSMARFPHRSTESGAHVLGPEAASPVAPALRQLVVSLVVEVGLAVTPHREALAAAAGWHRPRTHRAAGVEMSTVVDWTWREATWLGLVSLDAPTSFAEAVLAPDAPLPDALAQLFPAPVEQVIVQADLTAVAPGPLPPQLARELRLLADQESRGGAAVFRFSAPTVRRAFNAGWSAPEVHAWLEQHSATGVPQPLSYLVDDVARQFGSIRIGEAAAYLRSEDPVQAAAILAHPDAASLGLREIAPGVLLADAEPAELVGLVRSLGHSPLVEDVSGQAVTTPPEPRASSPLRERPPGRVSTEDVADALLRPEATAAGRDPDVASLEQTMAELREAVESARPLTVGYVQPDGELVERQLTPLDLAAGALRAIDLSSAQVATIPLARISTVRRRGG
jgi:hypothetical protein